ncbi:MAG: 4-alpha-glucanotransferase [Ruminococcaceae bacterium]|nr:4-alpha-glucanotransferase [Oscillospiraceae bacterium]
MRASGILMPIFSLPSPYGIGTFGKAAYNFVDFLKLGGQSYWQILPIGPTSFGDSPYQSFASFAGNPYFIDLDLLIKDDLLTESEIKACDFGDNTAKIDYEKLYNNRYPLLKKAFRRFKGNENYNTFIKENDTWLNDYALFMALKSANGGAAWYTWDKKLISKDADVILKAERDYIDDINFHKFLQFEFYKQWSALKDYANKNGVKIIGDIPIYVALDSADVWANPQQFQLDDDFTPRAVAGVPPDAFSEEGQLWGNPLYDWNYMKQTGYTWWKQYLGHALKRYDVVRIDHFRGFEAYYSIPYGDKNAKRGKWIKGPDADLFKTFRQQFGGDLPIIAEDLGVITTAVRKLLNFTGFPGMKVLQFAFSGDSENPYLPHNIIKNSVVYTGTHDNDTIMGWLENSDANTVKQAKDYFNYQGDSGFNWAMIKAAMSSVADTCVIPMADFMGLDSTARINTPSTLGENWTWRIDGGCINNWLANIIKENTRLYGRYMPSPEGEGVEQSETDEG